MIEESTKPENFIRIPLVERTAFYVALMEKMGTEHRNYKLQSEWLDEYRKPVGDIIDSVDNKDVRNLIMKGNYEDAAKSVIDILNEKKVKVAA